MILVEEKEVKVQVVKKVDKLYINTLIPEFEFKNGSGKTVKPLKCCANL